MNQFGFCDYPTYTINGDGSRGICNGCGYPVCVSERIKPKKSHKPLAVWNKCNGEAHSNPYIDNCMVCMPYWGNYPTCPIHNKKLKDTGYCETGKHFCKLRK